MKPLLLTTYGTCLKTRNRNLVLLNQDSGKLLEWLPVAFPYDSVIVENLGGFVTFQALRWLAANGIPLVQLDFNGSVLASYLPDAPLNARDRIEQLDAWRDADSRVEIARFILGEKLGKTPPECLQTLPALLMYEGREAKRYWADLGIVRDYPHARDPTNACINYAFGLLESRARVAVHRAGLLPEIGFLHAPQSPMGAKESLVYDVQEPFRESTVQIALSVKRRLNSRDFGEVFGHGLRLRPEAAHRLVDAFARGFPEKEMTRFVETLSRQFHLAGRVPPSRAAMKLSS